MNIFKANIMMRRMNHNIILLRAISRFLSALCRQCFPGQSGDRTCLALYKRLVLPTFGRLVKKKKKKKKNSGKFFYFFTFFLKRVYTYGYSNTSCFNLESQFSLNKLNVAVNSGVSTRSRPSQSFPKGSCWAFHAGGYCSGCRFDHVCFKCGAKHSASQCCATKQHRATLSKDGPVVTNSTQQSGHFRKDRQA